MRGRTRIREREQELVQKIEREGIETHTETRERKNERESKKVLESV